MRAALRGVGLRYHCICRLGHCHHIFLYLPYADTPGRRIASLDFLCRSRGTGEYRTSTGAETLPNALLILTTTVRRYLVTFLMCRDSADGAVLRASEMQPAETAG